MHCTPSSYDPDNNRASKPPVLFPQPSSLSKDTDDSTQLTHTHSMLAHTAHSPPPSSKHTEKTHTEFSSEYLNKPTGVMSTAATLATTTTTRYIPPQPNSYPPCRLHRHVWRSNPVALETIPDDGSSCKPDQALEQFLSLPEAAWHRVMGHPMESPMSPVEGSSASLAAMTDLSLLKYIEANRSRPPTAYFQLDSLTGTCIRCFLLSVSCTKCHCLNRSVSSFRFVFSSMVDMFTCLICC